MARTPTSLRAFALGAGLHVSFWSIVMATGHLNERATQLRALIRSKLLLPHIEPLLPGGPLPWFIGVSPLAIFFIFAVSEDGWVGIGLAVGITALFIAAYAARPPH